MYAPNVYSRAELQRLPRALRLAFTKPLIQSSALSPDFQTRHNFTAFDIYPTTHAALSINSFLYAVAQRGSVPSQSAQQLFPHRVHALGFTPELFEFLTSVSLHELNTAIIDFLVLLHHQLLCDSDHTGVENMQSELVPSVWREVQSQIGVFEHGEPTRGRRSAVLEHLVQISFMTPWRVDVFAIYTPSTYNAAPQPPPSPPTNRLVTKLLQDWALFDRALRPLALSDHEIVEALERCLASPRTTAVFHSANVFLRSKSVQALPQDVIDRIAAWVLRNSCERLPPRERRLASLKSLLALSSQRLDELSSTSMADTSYADEWQTEEYDEDDDHDEDDDTDHPHTFLSHMRSSRATHFPLHGLPWKRYRTTQRRWRY